MKVGETVSNIYNVNTDAFMSSLNVEHASSTVNIEKVNFYNAWNIHIMTWPDNVKQGKDDPLHSKVYGIDVNIKDSRIGKCGGPVILAQNPKREVLSK